MNILIIGGGGREHALAWKAAQSEKVETVYVAPGNAGTAREDKVENIDINAEDIDALKQFALQNNIELTIVGPEAPLVKGIVNEFQAANLNIFGPTRRAARLEGSKAFAKDFLSSYNIPTAAYGKFVDEAEAIAYIKQQGAPIVVKADGLAAGKGVILAQTEEQAIAAVKDMLSGNRFGEAGARVVVEEFLQGEEASFICMVDGKNILPMATSQDHKARDEGDTGPNTGGMGAYSPAPLITDETHQRIIDEIIRPTVEGMEKEGNPFTGFLYAGLMINQGDIKVLEYNVRFGDPETQPIMMRMQSDLVELCLACVSGELDQQGILWDSQYALGVVMAAGGYPGSYNRGDIISGLEGLDTHNSKVFHAGTALIDEQVVTHGGRVLCACGMGNSVAEAQKTAYDIVSKIQWDGVYYRKDIGFKAL
ncbi:Phosphoribosylamine--glycine ligase [hydrothermal vent metagenome]|uniref:Phosphoribosylamine--glycine ligase n=1 Tax=hydrothermal vent metagenome TaxID=652676 RepID=A0A3B0XLY0_9ZZZZ